MDKPNPAHFNLVKNKNKKIVRNLLREHSPQGIAQLATAASLSYPTVASLIKEMELTGEVILSDSLESCGGRPGMRYELNCTYQYGLVLRFGDVNLEGSVYNVYGKKVDHYSIPISSTVDEKQIVDFVTEIKNKYQTITVISFGIPGVVLNNDIKKLFRFPKMENVDLAKIINEELGCKLFIENDLNAIALAELEEEKCFAHIAYIDGGVGAGIVLNGKIIHGCSGYAGELSYLIDENKSTEENLAVCVLALTSLLDLPTIRISGEGFEQSTLDKIKLHLSKKLPEKIIPKLVISENLDEKYEQGLLCILLQYWENNI